MGTGPAGGLGGLILFFSVFARFEPWLPLERALAASAVPAITSKTAAKRPIA
jgi:hypothetical protein